MAVANATLNTGVEQTTDNTVNNPIDMSDAIVEIEPDNAPFVVLLNKLRKVKASNPKVEWMEGKSMPWLTTLTASATSAATTLSVKEDIFRVDDLVRITETGEACFVTATAAGTITVTRAVGGGAGSAAGAKAAASATSAAEVFIVTNANAEAATLREIKYPQLTGMYNYIQTERTPFGLTGLEMETSHFAGDERTRLRARFLIEHVRNIERTLFFGARSIQGTNKRTAGGVVEYLSTNVTTATTLTESTFKSFLRSGFRYGSDRKLFFCSPIVKGAIDGFPSLRGNIPPIQNIWGVNLTSYVSAAGTVDIIQHKDWNDSTIYGGYGFLIDPANVAYHYMRDTRLLPDRQAPDYDGFKDEYLTDFTLKFAQDATHAKLTGVTG